MALRRAVHYAAPMDEITIFELDRLEAERKLRSIPASLLESCWARETQIEAVIDAILIAATCEDANAYAHARHVGEWAARIAAELPRAPSPAFMRRCGVLAGVDPAILARLPEVRKCAPVVRAFQRLRMGGNRGAETRTAALIVAVADEFESLLGERGGQRGAANAMRAIARCADDESREIVQALLRAARATHLTPLCVTA